MDTLVPLKLPPGLYGNGTKYQAKGRWYKALLVRWYNDIMGPVGGWEHVVDTSNAKIQTSGAPRAAFGFRDNSNVVWIGVGTPTKLYQYSDQVLVDVTPAGFTTGTTDGAYTGGGYGNGTYGSGLYGSGGGAITLKAADTWQLDNYGQIMVSVFTGDGKVYQCTTPGAAATQVTNSPTNCLGVVVTPERMIAALGASGDPRLVKWSDQTDRTIWTAAVTNTAGSLNLQSKGKILAGRRARAQTLIWTETDLWAMNYIGGSLLYAAQQLGESCGLVGPNAMANVSDTFYWMSNDKQFFMYDGTVRQLECDVLDAIFPNILTAQQAKVVAVPISQFNEIWWFFPSSAQSGRENDSYVTYNYNDRTWNYNIGGLARAAGIDEGIYSSPYLFDPTGYLYQHETGTITSAMSSNLPYAESGPTELGDGNRLMVLQRLLPDEATLGDLKYTIYTAMNPTDTEVVIGPFTSTAPTTFRATGRQIRIRVDQVNSNAWRNGVMRIGVLPGSRR